MMAKRHINIVSDKTFGFEEEASFEVEVYGFSFQFYFKADEFVEQGRVEFPESWNLIKITCREDIIDRNSDIKKVLFEEGDEIKSLTPRGYELDNYSTLNEFAESILLELGQEYKSQWKKEKPAPPQAELF